MTAQPFVVVAGVGPGTGASVTRRFAKAYPVVLLARGSDKFEALAKEINDQGGKAVGISADVSNAKSLVAAFQQIEKEFPGAHCAAAVFNAAGGMVRKPFLEVSEEEFSSGWEVSQYVLAANLSNGSRSADIHYLERVVSCSRKEFFPFCLNTPVTRQPNIPPR